MAARSIALSEHLPAPRVEEAFLTGTLHDVGRVVYASQIGQTSAKGGVLTPAQFADIDNQTSVNEHHVEVGVYLLGLWTFPSQIVAAVALRDTPSRRADSGLDLTVLAHVADRLTNARWDDANP
jgi:HD-like signal output (HDOD) protein